MEASWKRRWVQIVGTPDDEGRVLLVSVAPNGKQLRTEALPGASAFAVNHPVHLHAFDTLMPHAGVIAKVLRMAATNTEERDHWIAFINDSYSQEAQSASSSSSPMPARAVASSASFRASTKATANRAASSTATSSRIVAAEPPLPPVVTTTGVDLASLDYAGTLNGTRTQPHTHIHTHGVESQRADTHLTVLMAATLVGLVHAVKEKHGFRHPWVKRWVELQNGIVTVYAAKGSKTITWQQPATEVKTQATLQTPRHLHEFDLYVRGDEANILRLTAATNGERDEWVTRINTIVDPTLDASDLSASNISMPDTTITPKPPLLPAAAGGAADAGGAAGAGGAGGAAGASAAGARAPSSSSRVQELSAATTPVPSNAATPSAARDNFEGIIHGTYPLVRAPRYGKLANLLPDLGCCTHVPTTVKQRKMFSHRWAQRYAELKDGTFTVYSAPDKKKAVWTRPLSSISAQSAMRTPRHALEFDVYNHGGDEDDVLRATAPTRGARDTWLASINCSHKPQGAGKPRHRGTHKRAGRNHHGGANKHPKLSPNHSGYLTGKSRACAVSLRAHAGRCPLTESRLTLVNGCIPDARTTVKETVHMFSHPWKRRYVTLTDGTIAGFEDDSCKKQVWSHRVAHAAAQSTNRTPRHPFEFDVVVQGGHGREVKRMTAASDADRNDWMQAIDTSLGIQRNPVPAATARPAIPRSPALPSSSKPKPEAQPRQGFTLPPTSGSSSPVIPHVHITPRGSHPPMTFSSDDEFVPPQYEPASPTEPVVPAASSSGAFPAGGEQGASTFAADALAARAARSPAHRAATTTGAVDTGDEALSVVTAETVPSSTGSDSNAGARRQQVVTAATNDEEHPDHANADNEDDMLAAPGDKDSPSNEALYSGYLNGEWRAVGSFTTFPLLSPQLTPRPLHQFARTTPWLATAGCASGLRCRAM